MGAFMSSQQLKELIQKRENDLDRKRRNKQDTWFEERELPKLRAQLEKTLKKEQKRAEKNTRNIIFGGDHSKNDDGSTLGNKKIIRIARGNRHDNFQW